MSLEIWMTYVLAVLILMSTPGPSQLLMLSNSLGNGFRRSIATALGDLSANAIQMIISSVGLIGILYTSQQTFTAIKWLGVAYLLYMGIRLIRQAKMKGDVAPQPAKSIGILYMQGFITSASNPKAVVFFAALFPQFLDATKPIAGQLLILGVTYIVTDGFFLSMYGSSADWIAKRFKNRMAQNLDTISGTFLIGAAVLLGLKNVED